jgi:hypothetical protein
MALASLSNIFFIAYFSLFKLFSPPMYTNLSIKEPCSDRRLACQKQSSLVDTVKESPVQSNPKVSTNSSLAFICSREDENPKDGDDDALI